MFQWDPIQYAAEKPADPLEVRVYPGHDADFTLYEDEGDGYAYEKGVYATIPLHWNDQAETLTVGDRKGEFPGMLRNRRFHVVFVGSGHGVGEDVTATADRVLEYAGKSVDTKR